MCWVQLPYAICNNDFSTSTFSIFIISLVFESHVFSFWCSTRKILLLCSDSLRWTLLGKGRKLSALVQYWVLQQRWQHRLRRRAASAEGAPSSQLDALTVEVSWRICLICHSAWNSVRRTKLKMCFFNHFLSKNGYVRLRAPLTYHRFLWTEMDKRDSGVDRSLFCKE